MTTKHYHVMNGNPGCLPDCNDWYTTKRAAQQAAREIKESELDNLRSGAASEMNYQELVSAYGFKGSARRGLYVRNDGHYYIEIATCDMAECENDE